MEHMNEVKDKLMEDIIKQSESIVDLKLEGLNEGFKFKITTGGDELDWLPEYMETWKETDPKTGKEISKTKINPGKLQQCKLKNIVEVPYKKNHIEAAIGINKEWKDLNVDERIEFLRSLKGRVLDKVLQAVNKKDYPDATKKKD